MTDDNLSQGIAAVKAGNKQEARRLLDAAIRAAPNDERTWGWFFNVCENDEERLRCVKEILRINPNNEKAKQKYDELIGLDYQTSTAASKTARASETTNKKRGLSLEWIVLGGFGGLIILAVAVIGVLFLIRNMKTPTASIPTLFPTADITVGGSSEFISNLKVFLADAEKLNIMTKQGATNPDYRNQLAQVKTEYTMLGNTWPLYLEDDKALFDKAISFWDSSLVVWDALIDDSYYIDPAAQDICRVNTGYDYMGIGSVWDCLSAILGSASINFEQGRADVTTKLK